jgi:hypothetical protein
MPSQVVRLGGTLLLGLVAGPLSAQTAGPASPPSMITTSSPGQQPAPEGADSSQDAPVTPVDQRKSVIDTVPTISPLSRINTRINNRIEIRINNRIGRVPTEPADTETTFERAQERSRRTGVRVRR